MPYRKLSPFLLTDGPSMENIPDIKTLELTEEANTAKPVAEQRISAENKMDVEADDEMRKTNRKRRRTESYESDTSSLSQSSASTTSTAFSFVNMEDQDSGEVG